MIKAAEVCDSKPAVALITGWTQNESVDVNRNPHTDGDLIHTKANSPIQLWSKVDTPAAQRRNTQQQFNTKWWAAI